MNRDIRRKLISRRVKRALAALMAFNTVGGTLLVNAEGEGYPETQTYPHNPYVGGWHNCTWGAWQLAYEYTGIALPGWHNAGQWAYDAANSGYTVSTVPAVGTIIVWSNHVAFVTDISEDGSKVYVKEGNYSGDYNEQWVDAYGPRGWQQLIGYIYLPNVDTSNIPEIYHGDLLDKAVNVYVTPEQKAQLEKEKKEKAEFERRQKMIEEEKERVTFDDNPTENETIKREDIEARNDVIKEDIEKYGAGASALLTNSNGFVSKNTQIADTFGDEMEFITILDKNEEVNSDEANNEETNTVTVSEENTLTVNNAESEVSNEGNKESANYTVSEPSDEVSVFTLDTNTDEETEEDMSEDKESESIDEAQKEAKEEITTKENINEQPSGNTETEENIEENKEEELVINNIVINKNVAASMSPKDVLSTLKEKIGENKETKVEEAREEAKNAILEVVKEVEEDSEKDRITAKDLGKAVKLNGANSLEILKDIKEATANSSSNKLVQNGKNSLEALKNIKASVEAKKNTN